MSRAGTGLLLLITAAGLWGASCLTIPEPVESPCADLETFSQVSPVLEQRCGSLDCHGSLARPLRIYGQTGLRAGGQVSGGSGTSELEFELTWRSVCGLEPERMGQVQSGELEPLDLLILKKPLLLERHKGGQLFQPGGAAEVCLESWLAGDVDEQDCAAAAKQL